MIEFAYSAKSIQGADYTGQVKAFDEHAAASILRKKGLIVVSLKSKQPQANTLLGWLLHRVNFSELVIATRQLATMVSSGLVLSDAIDILEEQTTNKTLKQTFSEISQDIKGGLTLAQALGKYPSIFPRLYVNLIKSGEASGKLDLVLTQMADGLEKDREFQAKVRGALIYPALVLGMMFVVVIIMMVFVIPKMINLYEQSTIELPLPTKILITTSNLFVHFWWAGLSILIALIVFLHRWNKTPQGSFLLGELMLKLPLIGKIVTGVTLTNFSRTFGLLISAGVPLLESIGIVSDLTGNPVFKKSLKDSYVGVERGLPFSTMLIAGIFPKIVGQMVKVGEETGKVDEIFFKLASYFESESEHLLKNLSVVIEPIVLIILGIGVGFLVISIILPIYKLTTSF